MDKEIMQNSASSDKSLVSILAELSEGLDKITEICKNIAEASDSGLPTEDVIQSYYN